MFYFGEKWKFSIFCKTTEYYITCAQVVTTKGFTLIRDKNLQIYFWVKRHSENDFLKNV